MSEDQERSEERLCRSNYFADTDQLHEERHARVIRCGLPDGHGGAVHAELDEDGAEVCTWLRKQVPPRTWQLPPEPGPEVTTLSSRDGAVILSRHVDDPRYWVPRSAATGREWSVLLWPDAFHQWQPLTVATPTGEQPSTERSDG